jgi:hypothetical protein
MAGWERVQFGEGEMEMMFTPDLSNGHDIDTTGRCEVRHGTRI